MKPISLRTRLIVSFWLVLLLGLALPSLFFQKQLQKAVFGDSEERIRKELALIHWNLKTHGSFSSFSDLDSWCTQAAQHLGVRITYIADGGKVIADSHVPYDKLKFMDNHWNRPEVAAARTRGFGISTRRSDTLRRELVYAAVSIKGDKTLPEGVLRIAMPVSAIEERIEKHFRYLFLVLIITFLGLSAVAYLLSSYIERPVAHLVEVAKAIGNGEYRQKKLEFSYPSLNTLATTIQQMAQQIGQQLQSLENQKAQLHAILESMKEGIVLLSREGRIAAVNRAVYNIRKYPVPCKGLKPMEVFLDPELQKACDRVIAGQESARIEISPDGDRYYDVQVISLKGASSDMGAVIVFHDISQIKRLARVRRDFVANVSHELRTPLTAIKGYAETLLHSGCAGNREHLSFIEIILRKTDHMTRMVNDLLKLSSIESQARLPQTATDVRSAVSAAIETCLPAAENKEMDIIQDLPDEPLIVKSEMDHLIQVFNNLIENAIRYSDPRTSVRIRATVKQKEIIFSVEDQGPGIRPEDINRIFERFYRVDKQRETATGSTGLGLAICKHIVEKMGGRIWALSPVPGSLKGTAFFFSLRRADTDRKNTNKKPEEV